MTANSVAASNSWLHEVKFDGCRVQANPAENVANRRTLDPGRHRVLRCWPDHPVQCHGARELARFESVSKQGQDHYEPVIAMNEKRKRLLIELEDIIGHEFYNAKIQNWGPGGVFEGEGRELRYPVTFHDKDGKTIKTKHVDANLPAGTIMTGGYKLGQNELRIMRALDLMLTHLERKHGLHLGKTKG